MIPEPLWQVVGQSVRGASHVRADLPNQDAISWRPPTQSGPPLILVVSDGHGSAKSFRSDRGSRFAVAVAADLLHELVSVQPDPQNLSMVKRTAEERLPTELVRRWQVVVDQDLAEHPFTDSELEALAAQRGERSRQDVEAMPRLAYGATVLGVLVTRDFLLFLQLGDGDILTVADDGGVARPIDRDARLIANETTSLCMSEAWREVRHRFQANYGALPALIMVSTDGYANSFVNDAAFLRVASDILAMMREDGVAPVVESLPAWLSEASAAGSGDDISLGLIYRADAVGVVPVASSAENEVPANRDVDMGGAVATCRGAATSAAASAQHVASEEALSSAPLPSSGGREQRRTVNKGRGAEDSDMRSRFVARIKHEGPSEPSKHARLTDVVGEDKAAPVDIPPGNAVPDDEKPRD